MAGCWNLSASLTPPIPLILKNSRSLLLKLPSPGRRFMKSREDCLRNGGFRVSRRCTGTEISETETEYETEGYDSNEEYAHVGEDKTGNGKPSPPVRRRIRRCRKQYPGEKEGISEEMRFVAMKLRNNKSKSNEEEKESNFEEEEESSSGTDGDERTGGTWQPSLEGFLKYLVDSELVFRTIERIVDDSSDVSYVYFRRTGLERSANISRDLEWFKEMGNAIPEPSNLGIQYAKYLEELSDECPPSFLSHFYNIYFTHIAGGQVMAKQVVDKLLEGSQLDFIRWDGDEEEMLRGVREKLNALGEHWSRNEKNRCLKEATKAFRYLGQIVRLIIL